LPALLVLLAGIAFVPATRAPAALTPAGAEYRKLTFPVREHVTYTDDFGGARQHPGNDLMGKKLMHELAANNGTITFVRADSSGHSGNMLILTGTDGWKYWYIHINNDTPGTDDGKNPAQWRFAPGIKLGVHVKAGQFIAYMGDSGEAETTDPHLHFELHKPDDSFIDPYPSLRLAQGLSADGQCHYPTNPKATPNASASNGIWTLSAAGLVLRFGHVRFHPQPPAAPAGDPYVAIEPTSTRQGYWIVDAVGRVRAFGDAHAYGGMNGHRLNAPMIGIAKTPTDHGYWLLARDGGIFSFGDAHFYGSTGGMHLNKPIIAMASSVGGHGYWLLGADGGIFTFGDTRFYGSTGGMHLTIPMVAMSATPSGKGYWLVATNGSVYNFGDAHFYGSIPGTGACGEFVVQTIQPTQTGAGYWLLLSNGRIIAFGDAWNWASPLIRRRPPSPWRPPNRLCENDGFSGGNRTNGW
jgi:hypothetical protein